MRRLGNWTVVWVMVKVPMKKNFEIKLFRGGV